MPERDSSLVARDAPLLRPRPAAARRRPTGLVETELDDAQRAAVEHPLGGALLVLGEAGHGKTTVAVHRAARVVRALRAARGPGGDDPRAAFLVPTVALARLVQSLLRRLGVDVEALPYERFAREESRRVFRDLPRRESELTRPSTVRLKRSPALRGALAALAPREPGRIDDDREARGPRRSRGALVRRGDLQHLFGDRLLLEAVAREDGTLGAHAVADTLEHTRTQFSLRTERAWAHVDDRQRLVAVDGRALDEGTSSADATSVDTEDYAVLWALERLRAARRGQAEARPRPYDLVVIDEAQELAPLELELVGRALAPGGTLVVAGDADQQTDPTTSFFGWDATLRALGAARWETATLEVGYRCPPDVVGWARAVRDGHTGPALPPARGFADARALVEALAPALEDLRARDRSASVLVATRDPRTARRLTEALVRAGVPSRLVFDGKFIARGAVQVTTVDETKGLEADHVVVPDADAASYPDDAPSRRALYVALTRARHQALVAFTGSPSPLVRAG